MLNLKKWFSKNKLLVVIMIILAVMHFNRQLIESFIIADLNVIKMNNALDSIIACKKSGKCDASSGIVSNFTQFKKKLKYPNFSVTLFNELLNNRKEKGEHLNRDEIVLLVEKGKYEDSFNK